MRVNIDGEQINLWDDRFYAVPLSDAGKIPKEYEYLVDGDKIYLPSSTHILDVSLAKGKQFESWLKDVGHSAKIIATIAAEKGTRVHRACELLLMGEEISYDTIIDVETKYTDKHMGLDEWRGVLGFKEFYDVVQPTDVISEAKVYNLEQAYAGTVDIQCTIGKERWIVDIKFSAAVYESNYLQVESYARCVEGIDNVGILHLRAATRGADKRGKNIQGKGWRLFKAENRDELWQTWLSLLNIYKFKNGGETPKSISIPKTVKLWD